MEERVDIIRREREKASEFIEGYREREKKRAKMWRHCINSPLLCLACTALSARTEVKGQP